MLKSIVQGALRSAGLEVRRARPAPERIMALMRLVQRSGVNAVLDVGANEGQFACQLRMAGWRGEITSFEPLRDAHATLCRNASDDARWAVAPRGAIGAQTGTATINISGNSQSSSLLPMLDRHRTTAPGSTYVASDEVQVRRLDDLVPLGEDQRYLLKMDVQGFERDVLDGADLVLERTHVLYSEMALQPLYEGEALFHELCGSIIGRGFRCAGLFNGHYDGSTDEVLQCDALFVR